MADSAEESGAAGEQNCAKEEGEKTMGGGKARKSGEIVRVSQVEPRVFSADMSSLYFKKHLRGKAHPSWLSSFPGCSCRAKPRQMASSKPWTP